MVRPPETCAWQMLRGMGRELAALAALPGWEPTETSPTYWRSEGGGFRRGGSPPGLRGRGGAPSRRGRGRGHATPRRTPRIAPHGENRGTPTNVPRHPYIDSLKRADHQCP